MKLHELCKKITAITHIEVRQIATGLEYEGRADRLPENLRHMTVTSIYPSGRKIIVCAE